MLLDKNGKPFQTFSRPNPLIKNQNEITKDKLIFHNFHWKPTVIENTKNKPKTNKTNIMPIVGPVEEKPNQEKPTNPVEHSKEIKNFLELLKSEAKTLKEEKIVSSSGSIENDETIIVHCHPLIIKERTDELYGETRQSTSYGKKFEFEALLVDSSDLEIILYTKNKLDLGSILYPSKYKFDDNKSLGMYRWWIINQIVPNRDGFLIFGQITDKHRDFSH